jgi:hypothetical protein
MNFKSVASLASVVTFLFGIAFLLLPFPSLVIYGYQGSDPVVAIMTRYFGSAFITFGMFAWGVRSIDNTDVQRATARLIAIGNLTGAGVSILAALSGVLNAMAWSSVAIYLIFAALWARVGYMR